MCRENDIGILPYSPLQQGLLSGKFRKLEDVPEGRRRTRLFNSQRYFEAIVTKATQGCHGTGKTGNLKVHFSRQGKHREFAKKY